MGMLKIQVPFLPRAIGLAGLLFLLLLQLGFAHDGGAPINKATQLGSPYAFLSPTGDQNWDDRFNQLGVNGPVFAIAGAGNNIYIGGAFTTVGGIRANHIARWDGQQWSTVGEGLNDWVYAIAVNGSDVYAGGRFTAASNSSSSQITANYVAKWNGSQWSALAGGVDNWVFGLAVSGSDIYAGGWFIEAINAESNRVTANHIARWNGSQWSTLTGGVNDNVYAVAARGADVYVGGSFTQALNGGEAVTTNNIAHWNGERWLALGGGVNDAVYALAISGTDLYVGGWFTTASDAANTSLTVNHIARWNGSQWSTLGAGVNDWVLAITVVGNVVYAGGPFTIATNSGTSAVTVNNIAHWNGTQWSALGNGLNDAVYAILAQGTDVYVGGEFTTAGNRSSIRFARWRDTGPSGFGHNLFFPYIVKGGSR